MKVSSLAELERDWSIEDVAIAHDWLDELEAAQAEARHQAEQKGGA